MANDEKKEAKVLDNIADTVAKLDSELEKLDTLNADTSKEHEFKKWYAEKKAIHDVKHILHDVGKYSKYDEDEIKKVDAYFDSLNKK